MKPTVLSPSSISLFLECPRCFWLQINKRTRRPSGPFPSLPSGMDKVLKQYFDKHRSNHSLPEEMATFKGHLFDDTEKLAVWRNNRKGLRFLDPTSGITLMGAIDDLFVTDKGFHVPIDFKTRGYPLKEDTHEYYQHQMDIYSFLLEKNGFKSADFAVLLFYYPTCVNSHCSVEFHSDVVKVTTSMENAEKLFRDAVGTVRGKIPPKTEDCPFCNWNSSET